MTAAPSPAARYTRTAIVLHWLTALLLIGSFTLGFIMVNLKISPTALKLFAYHKWIGITVFLLSLLRVAWRIRHPAPPPPASTPDWQVFAAAVVHHLLYILLFAAPLSGWLMSSAKGFQTVYLKLIPIPDLLAKNPPLGELLETVHVALVWLLLITFVVHVAAALKHQFVDRDGVLGRMLPLPGTGARQA